MTSQRLGRGMEQMSGTEDGVELRVDASMSATQIGSIVPRRVNHNVVQRSIDTWQQAVRQFVEILEEGLGIVTPIVARVVDNRLSVAQLVTDALDITALLAALMRQRRGAGSVLGEAAISAMQLAYLDHARDANAVNASLSLRASLLLHDNGLIPLVSAQRLDQIYCTHTLPRACETLAEKTRFMLDKCERFVVQGAGTTTSSAGESARSQSATAPAAPVRGAVRARSPRQQ